MNQIMDPMQRRVTKAEAARQLGIDFRAIQRLIADGDLKVVSVPGNMKAIVLQSSIDGLIDRIRASERQAG